MNGSVRSLVVARTRAAQGFGHDYPEDRAWQALYSHRAYNSFPAHVRSLDVGFMRESGELVSAGDATEFFQLVEKADGALYWRDLERLLTEPLRPSTSPGRGRSAPSWRAPTRPGGTSPRCRAPHPRAGGTRRVPDGDPRQLSASLRAVAAARL